MIPYSPAYVNVCILLIAAITNTPALNQLTQKPVGDAFFAVFRLSSINSVSGTRPIFLTKRKIPLDEIPAALVYLSQWTFTKRTELFQKERENP